MKIKIKKKSETGEPIIEEVEGEVESLEGYVSMDEHVAVQKSFEDFKRSVVKPVESVLPPIAPPVEKQSIFDNYINRRLKRWKS
jgi:hypothetical protein